MTGGIGWYWDEEERDGIVTSEKGNVQQYCCSYRPDNDCCAFSPRGSPA